MIKKKVGRPKIKDSEKVKYKRIPVRIDTAERLDEVKVTVQRKLNKPSLTYSQLVDIFINDSKYSKEEE